MPPACDKLPWHVHTKQAAATLRSAAGQGLSMPLSPVSLHSATECVAAHAAGTSEVEHTPGAACPAACTPASVSSCDQCSALMSHGSQVNGGLPACIIACTTRLRPAQALLRGLSTAKRNTDAAANRCSSCARQLLHSACDGDAVKSDLSWWQNAMSYRVAHLDVI